MTPAEVQAMGVSTAKQYLAAVALLQRFQHTLLHGDLVGVPITRAACVKLTLSHVRKHENTRRQTSMVDAAASECPWFKKMMTGSVHGRHLSYILYNACLTLSVEHTCFFPQKFILFIQWCHCCQMRVCSLQMLLRLLRSHSTCRCWSLIL